MNERLVSVVIVGARGRMGMTLIRCVLESDDLTLVGAVEHADAPGIGDDVGRLVGMPELGIEVGNRLAPPRGSVVVDFSLPQATDANVERCVDHGVPLVLGTTGISDETRGNIEVAAKYIPIVSAPNFSVGVTLLTRLAGIAASALGRGWDAELFELHHKHKRDAPSGTALRLGQAIAEATDRSFERVATLNRNAIEGPRREEQIGVATLRGGDSVGEHTIMFLGDGERLELSHRALDRAIFARGALRAARWISDKPPGLYDMVDVLGLGDV